MPIHSSEKNLKQNYDSIDLLKMILCIFVVSIHTGFLSGMIYPIVRIAVPCFFIITGFFTFNNLDKLKSAKEKKEKCMNIVKRYLLLYVFWVLCNLPYTVYTRDFFKQNFSESLVAFIKSLLRGNAFPGSWYIIASALGIILIYILSCHFSNKQIILITIPFYLYATFTCEFSLAIQSSFPILNKINDYFTYFLGYPQFSFCIALLYIAIGKLLANNIEYMRDNIKIYLGLLAASVFLLFGEYYYISTKNFFIYNNDCLFTLLPVAVFTVLMSLNTHIKCRYSKSIRNISTIIYCSHITASAIFRKVLSILNITDNQNILLFILTFCSCLLGSCLILRLEQHKKFKWLKLSH